MNFLDITRYPHGFLYLSIATGLLFVYALWRFRGPNTYSLKFLRQQGIIIGPMGIGYALVIVASSASIMFTALAINHKTDELFWNFGVGGAAVGLFFLIGSIILTYTGYKRQEYKQYPNPLRLWFAFALVLILVLLAIILLAKGSLLRSIVLPTR